MKTSKKNKGKGETVYFLQGILTDLKTNYNYDTVVIDKVLQHLDYQTNIYKDDYEDKTK